MACGKLAIVRAILEAERNSTLFNERRDPSVDSSFVVFSPTPSSDFPTCWLKPFFTMLVENISRDDVGSLFENVSFVIFNYDRCVETYLHRAISKYYDLSAQAASDLLNKVVFLHPYGTVGRLPWQEGDGAGVPFGNEPNPHQLRALAEGIHVFSERYDNASYMARMNSGLTEAQTVVFLGFSYQRQNMDLLKVSGSDRTCRVFGTALDVSNSDLLVIAEDIRRSLALRLSIEPQNLFDGKCMALFAEFQRSIPA